MPILNDLRINGRSVALIEIRNDGTGTDQRGNYDVHLYEGLGATRSATLAEKHRTKSARVTFYDRSLGAVELLRQALNALEEEE